MAAAERPRLRRLRHGLAIPALVLSACAEPGPFHHLDVRDQTIPGTPFRASRAPDVDLGATSLRLVDGIATQARVSAIDDADEPMPVLELRSRDPEVFEVTRAPDLGRYVFFGAAPGSSELVIVSDGQQVGTVPVTVEPQRPR